MEKETRRRDRLSGGELKYVEERIKKASLAPSFLTAFLVCALRTGARRR